MAGAVVLFLVTPTLTAEIPKIYNSFHADHGMHLMASWRAGLCWNYPCHGVK